MHRLECLRSLHGGLVELPGGGLGRQVSQLDEPLLILQHVAAAALPLQGHIGVGPGRRRRAGGRRLPGLLRFLPAAEVFVIGHRIVPEEHPEGARPRDAVRRETVGLLEELHRPVRSGAELSVRCLHIAQGNQLLLQRRDAASAVAFTHGGEVFRRDRCAALRLQRLCAACGHSPAAVQLLQRALARDAVCRQAVSPLERAHGLRRLRAVAAVDAPRVIPQLEELRLQEIDVLPAVALVHGRRHGGHRRGRRAGGLAAAVQLAPGGRCGGAVRREAVGPLIGHQGLLGLHAEDAVRHPVEIAQLDKPLLQGIDVVARHAQGKPAAFVRVRHGDGIPAVFGRRGVELRLRLDAGLPVGGKPAGPLERLHRVHCGAAVNAVHTACIVAQLHEPRLKQADVQPRRALLQQHIGLLLGLRADHVGHRRRRVEQVLRLPAGDAVRRQAVFLLEGAHRVLRRAGVASVDGAAVVAQLGELRLQVRHIAARGAQHEHWIPGVVVILGGLPAHRVRFGGRRRPGRRRGQNARAPVLPVLLAVLLPVVRRCGRLWLRRGRRGCRRERRRRSKGHRPVADGQGLQGRIRLHKATRQQEKRCRQHEPQASFFPPFGHASHLLTEARPPRPGSPLPNGSANLSRSSYVWD